MKDIINKFMAEYSLLMGLILGAAIGALLGLFTGIFLMGLIFICW